MTQDHGETLFVRQMDTVETGDYQESWQPAAMEPKLLKKPKTWRMRDQDVGRQWHLGGRIFIKIHATTAGMVYFSELSPRPTTREW